jgi:hypothetical protein
MLDAGLMRVDASLDGGAPFPAVFDLGASVSIVNAAAAATGHAQEAPGPRGKAMGADGEAADIVPARFGRLDVGAFAFASPTLYVADLPVFATLGLAGGPAMILGLDQIGARTVTIDYHRHELLLR